MSYASNEKPYVVTYKELIFVVFIFSSILIALYPKDLLKRQIVSEQSNYDLSMLYLKNLLAHDPHDESLMLILATQSLRIGDKELALNLLDTLSKSKKKKIREKAILLSYELQKEVYFSQKDKIQKRKEKKKLREIFYLIYNLRMYDKRDFEKWYDEAVLVGARLPTYEFLKMKVDKNPKDIALLKSAFYLSINFHRKHDSFRFIKLLKLHDKKHLNDWILKEYYMYMDYKQYLNAQELLLKHYDNREFKELLAEFYLYTKKYKKASKIYLEFLHDAKDIQESKKYFKKALSALVSSDDLKGVMKLMSENEDKFMGDKDMREYILRTYLSSGKLDEAAKFAKKILKIEYFK